MIVFIFDHSLLNRLRRKQSAIRPAVFGQSVFALLVHLTLHTVLVVVTPRIASRTRIAVFARVMSFGRVLAFTFAAHTFAFTRTHFRFTRRNASFVRNQAIACGVLVPSIAYAFAAIACAVIRAEFVVATFTRKVVAFAETAGEHLFRVGTRQAFALAAQASSATVANEGRAVVAALLV